LPWRPLPEEESAPDTTGDDPALTGDTPPPAPLPGAYAKSS
jgi:alpha-1,6-mannosyltransferase